MIIDCLVADDEPIARTGMRRLIEQVPFLRLAGVARDASEVSQFLLRSDIQLLFLDIQMPGISGIELMKQLPHPPKVIFTTAYPEYAIEGYDLDILDYLLKPITLPRFVKAANRAKEYFSLANQPGGTPPATAIANHIFVKTNRQLQKIMIEEILFVEAMLNYVIIHTAKQKIITYASIKSMQENLPGHLFMKIHKSFLVALSKIQGVQGNELIIGAHRLPISRNHKEALLNALK